MTKIQAGLPQTTPSVQMPESEICTEVAAIVKLMGQQTPEALAEAGEKLSSLKEKVGDTKEIQALVERTQEAWITYFFDLYTRN